MSSGPYGWSESGRGRPYSSLDLYGGDQLVLTAESTNSVIAPPCNQ